MFENVKVNEPISLLGSNCTENNLIILKRVIFRFAEKIVSLNNNILENGDVEKIKFLVNNIVNRYPFAPDVHDYMLLEENGYHVDFKSGSALSKISSLNNKAREDDINLIVDLYSNESTIFLTELRELVRPTLTALITSFDDVKRVKLKNSGSNYNIKLVNEVELFTHLESSNKLTVVGNGNIPAALSLGFPLRSEIAENEEAIRNLFVVRDSEENEIIQSVVRGIEAAELLKFWNKYMLNISVENTSLTSLYSLHFRKTVDLVLLYAALTRILDGDVEYVTSLTSLEANKVNIRDFLNTFILKFISYYKAVANNFILDYNVEDNITVIYISQNGYERFLEEGGSVDSVVGFVIKSKQQKSAKYATMETVLGDDKLKLYYENSVRVEKMADFTYNLKTISDQWLSYTGKIINDFASIKDTRVCNMNVCKDKENQIIDYLRNLSNDDVFDTVKVMVNVVKIINPEVGNFISNMNNLMSSDGRDNVSLAKEASLYATIQRLADKLLSDTTTVKK